MKTTIMRVHAQDPGRLRFALTVQLEHSFDGYNVLLNTEEVGDLAA